MAHVQITTDPPRIDVTAGSSAAPIPFPYGYFAATDLQVYVGGVLKTLTTDYTVAGNAVDGGFQGGTVTLVSYPASGTAISVIRNTPIERTTDFPYPSPTLNIEALNTQLDEFTAWAQQVETDISRTLAQPTSDTVAMNPLPVAASRASYVLAFDSSGNPVMSDQTLAAIEAGSTNAAASATAAAASAIAAASSATSAASSANSASTSATSASNSAVAAAASAASAGWDKVKFLTHASSPYTVVQADGGTMFDIDTSGGNVTVNLTQIGSLTLPFVVGVKKATGDANTVSIVCGGTDTFDDGTTTRTLATVLGTTLIPETTTTPKEWVKADWGGASYSASSGVKLVGSTFEFDITSAPVGTAANDLVQLDASARLPAVDGSRLTSLKVMTATAAGIVPTPPNDATKFLDGTGAFSTPSGVTKFTSSQTAIPAAGATTSIAHGLGAVPFGYFVLLHCVTADQGYSIGDEVLAQISGGIGTAAGQLLAKADATNVKVTLNSAGTIYILRPDTGAQIAITNADWKFIVKAFL